MKEKEEAKRIIELYNNAQSWRSDKGIYLTSKQYALIHVDGILNALFEYDNKTEEYLKEEFGISYFSAELQNMDSDFRYWQKVKQQIENY